MKRRRSPALWAHKTDASPSSRRPIRACPRRGTRASRARGTYLQLLDADDCLLPTKFERQLRALESAPDAAVCICDYFKSLVAQPYSPVTEAFAPPAIPTRENVLTALILDWETRLSIPIHCYLFRRDFLRLLRLRFDPALPNHEDWDFVVRLFLDQPRAVFVRDRLAAYCQHDRSMCVNFRALRAGYLAAIDGLRRREDVPRPVRLLLSRKRSEVIERYGSILGDLSFPRRLLRLSRRVRRRLLGASR